MRAEDVYIYAENPHILRLHMLCSAKELPLNSIWPVSILQRDFVLARYDGRDSHISHTTNSSSNNNSSNGNSNNSNTVRKTHATTASKLEGEISYESYMNKEGIFDSDIDPVEFGRNMYRNSTTNNNSNNNSNSNSSSSSNYVSTNSMINSSSNTGSTSSNNTHSISNGIVIEESDIWGGAETYSTVLDYLVSTQSLLPSLLNNNTHTIYTPRPTIHTKFTNNTNNSSSNSSNGMFSLRVIDSITIHIHDDSRDSIIIDSIGYSRAFYEVYIGIYIIVYIMYRYVTYVYMHDSMYMCTDLLYICIQLLLLSLIIFLMFLPYIYPLFY